MSDGAYCLLLVARPKKKGGRKKDDSDDNASILELDAGFLQNEKDTVALKAIVQTTLDVKEHEALNLRCRLEASEGPLISKVNVSF